MFLVRLSNYLISSQCCSLPLPQCKHLARSLPVPRGNTATAGLCSKFSLSEIKNTCFFNFLPGNKTEDLSM